MKSLLQLGRFSTFLNTAKIHLKNPIGFSLPSNYKKIPILLPHRTMPSVQGQDLDFVNIAYSHLVHSEWDKLNKLASGLTPFRIKHILLKTRKDYVLSLEFFKWVEEKNSELNTLDVNSMILHILTKNRKFKSAESILWRILDKGLSELDFPRKVFEALVYSYRMCESSPRVFDALFKTYAHMKEFRNASDSFCWMREYGFYPTVESCNAYLSALNGLNRGDIALAIYKEMCRCRISPNVYTINMVIGAYCKAGNLEMAVEVFREMERMGLDRNVVSYNTLIAGYCSKGLLSRGLKLKNVMEKNGIQPNDATYNTLINALCKEGKLHEVNKLFREMKSMDVAPTTVTYNTLINGYSEAGNSEMGIRLFEEMSVSGVKADILTYNAVIMGLCKEGKTKKAAYMVKELDREKLVPNSSTFAALITGQCARNNAERAFQLYQSMVRSGCHPNGTTFKMLMSAFIKNEDYDGAVQVLKQMMERAIAPDSDITHLFNGLCQCGKEEFAMDLCKELESQRLVPEVFVKSIWTS
ncbi:UNVERIFIED_CONTAM: Pentatricopeptide repeat-containing protein, mitochondrial [Sesamum latifolium]|uniref:Pentatricopeptide repeat-containing protein, mitochondrial n=1 Tax=Sesamum latifolium TaxID=2727402 RepID=A0AAW2VEZ9_9LAMI